MGTGRIASDFASAMRTLPKEEHQIVAVAATSLKKAKEFGAKFNAKHAFEGYENVANCPEVDIVYVTVLNTGHFECAKLALEAGKPVLCEKPMGMNSKQVKQLVQFARQKGVFFMEAFWSRCFPVYDEIRAALKDGRIGVPKGVQINFGFVAPDDPVATGRQFKKDMGGSALLDIGCYTIMFVTMAFNGERPTEIKAWGELNKDGVDVSDTVMLKYSNGAYAQVIFSMRAEMSNTAAIFGTKGKIEVHRPFASPESAKVHKTVVNKPLPESNDHFFYPNSVGLSYEAKHVRECLLKGLKESPLMPLEHSEVVVSIMDEIRKQVGVVYPEDSQ